MAGAESRPEQSPGLFRIGRRRSPAKDDSDTGQPDGTDSLSFAGVFGQFLSFPRSRSLGKCVVSRTKVLDKMLSPFPFTRVYCDFDDRNHGTGKYI